MTVHKLSLSSGEMNALRTAVSTLLAEEREDMNGQETAALRRLAYVAGLAYVPGERDGERDARLGKAKG